MSGDGTLTNITLKPGVYKNTTDLGAEGHYTSCDKVRWHYGQPQKIGGWVNELVTQFDFPTSTHFTGVARDTISWQNNEGSKQYLGVGTHKKLEVFYGGQIYDITPIRMTVSVCAGAGGFTTSVGSTWVLLSVASNLAAVGDYLVVQSVATSVGGISLSGQYEVVSVVGANVVYFDSRVTATGTSVYTSSGTVVFLLNNGFQSNQAAIGWGSGGYGRQGYGTPLSAGSGEVFLDQWSLDNWGEDLVACRRGDHIYYWPENGGLLATEVNRVSVRATTVSASPSVNNFILVHDTSRYLLSFGCTELDSGEFNPLHIRWCNQEDLTTWDPLVSIAGGNTSGSLTIKGGSQIIGAVESRGEIITITDSPVYRVKYEGTPYIFTAEQIGEHAGGISQHCMIDIQGVIYWMGTGDFHIYDGVVKTLPCDIQDVVFRTNNPESLNFYQKEKVFAGVNSQFNEIIWLYPSSASDEIDRYIIYNYLEGTWYDGTMDRTVWEDAGVFAKPYAISEDGSLFVQETGVDDGPRAMPFFYESAYFDIQDGEDFVFTDKIVPDFRRVPAGKQLSFTITTKSYPQDPNPVVKGPYFIQDTTKKISLRARGRQAKYRVESSGTGVDFEMGVLKMNIIPDGKR